jgi:hypothetical protein
MPNRRSPATKPIAPEPTRQRYDRLEAGRAELIARLRTLDEKARQHAAYNRVLKLLNDTFRKSKLPQRLAVLQAATWRIDVLASSSA